jgi:NADH:ubiquinone oxidoreductase subunit 4 (subunit M)
MLWLYQRTFFGRAPGMAEDSGHAHGGHGNSHAPSGDSAHVGSAGEHSHAQMPDLNFREWVAIAPLLILMVWMGVAAQTFLPSISASNAATLQQTRSHQEFRVSAPSTTEVADAR